MIKNTIALLGLTATDRVTGFTGVVTNVCFELYGCVQAIVSPRCTATDQETKPGQWFDVNRLKIITGCAEDRAMDVPDFDSKTLDPGDYNHGAALKSLPRG